MLNTSRFEYTVPLRLHIGQYKIVLDTIEHTPGVATFSSLVRELLHKWTVKREREIVIELSNRKFITTKSPVIEHTKGRALVRD